MQLRKIMDALVTKKLKITDLCKNGNLDFDLVNAHVFNVDKTRRVSLLYYLVLIPEYYQLVQTLFENSIIDIPHTTIEPEGICDPINFCHPIYIKMLWAYGFPIDIPRFKVRFMEGVCSSEVLKETFACIGDPTPFCSSIDYDHFLNRMVLTCLAAMKSKVDVRKRIKEQYMLALAYLFRYSTRLFTTHHLNKLMTCKDKNIIERILRYYRLHNDKFDFKLYEVCHDTTCVDKEIIDIVVNTLQEDINNN